MANRVARSPSRIFGQLDPKFFDRSIARLFAGRTARDCLRPFQFLVLGLQQIEFDVAEVFDHVITRLVDGGSVHRA